jgi:hypothetical protein
MCACVEQIADALRRRAGPRNLWLLIRARSPLRDVFEPRAHLRVKQQYESSDTVCPNQAFRALILVRLVPKHHECKYHVTVSDRKAVTGP